MNAGRPACGRARATIPRRGPRRRLCTLRSLADFSLRALVAWLCVALVPVLWVGPLYMWIPREIERLNCRYEGPDPDEEGSNYVTIVGWVQDIEMLVERGFPIERVHRYKAVLREGQYDPRVGALEISGVPPYELDVFPQICPPDGIYVYYPTYFHHYMRAVYGPMHYLFGHPFMREARPGSLREFVRETIRFVCLSHAILYVLLVYSLSVPLYYIIGVDLSIV